jgi:5-methyltetrahydrofolate--homocysteine methyltransferase
MDLEQLYQHVIEGNTSEVEAGVHSALEAGINANTILGEALIPAMDEVGRRFEEGDFFVPEMLVAAHAMQAGMRILKPRLVTGETQSAGKVAIGTVKGDLHDIGKNLVAMMLEGAGFEVRDLGVDISPDAFVQAAQEGIQIISMSALLTTTMINMRVTIEALKAAGLRDNVKVMIGGAPVTQDYADQIGADAFAPDASSAVRAARHLMA